MKRKGRERTKFIKRDSEASKKRRKETSKTLTSSYEALSILSTDKN